jgi:hypothetical protein
MTPELEIWNADGESDDFELRRACVEHLVERGEGVVPAELLPDNPPRVVRIMASGWILNGLTVISLLTLVLAVPMQTRRAFMAGRVRRRVRDGVCPACLYPLPSDGPIRCSECGWGTKDAMP